MITLTCLDRIKIKDEDAKLTEPSGLVLSHDGRGLWTVSDDTKRIFYLTLEGKLKRDRCFKVPDKGLEGLTIEPNGEHLFAVREERSEVIKLNIETQKVTDLRRLASMTGYQQIARFFGGRADNKGLEGLTWNTQSGTLFALKEGKPGLLIEISADLEAILGHSELDADLGFVDPGTPDDDIDYSGICFDPSRGQFWIVSDKARRVYLYDSDSSQVVQSAPLAYAKDGELREVKKAEGVAYDSETSRLYVVSDEEVRLYVFDVRA